LRTRFIEVKRVTNGKRRTIFHRLPDVKGQETGEANLNFVISEPKRSKKTSLSGAIDKRPAGQFPEHEGFWATFQTQLSLSDRRITLLLAILAQTGASNVECLDFILSGSRIAATVDVAFTGFDRGSARRTAHKALIVPSPYRWAQSPPTARQMPKPRPIAAAISQPLRRPITGRPIRSQISRATSFAHQAVITWPLRFER
jgi:hypothetical protein